MTLYRITDHWWLDKTLKKLIAFRSRKFITCHSNRSVLINASVLRCAKKKKKSRMRVLIPSQLIAMFRTLKIKNAIKKVGSPCWFLSCSAVIRENHQKNLSFGKNYECYRNLGLVCFPGVYIISPNTVSTVQSFSVVYFIQILQLLLSST